MKKNCKISKYAAYLLLLLQQAPVVPAQMTGVEILAFRVPEYDAQGVMTSQLFGDRAEVGEDNVVNITGLRIEFYKGSHTVMTVASPYCFYNQKTREAHSDAPIAADMEKLHVRGQGFFLKPGDSTVRILNSSQVTIEDMMQKVKGNTPLTGDRGTNAVTVITSKELFLDHKAKKVRFEQTVHVQDPKMVMDCGTLEVRFGEKNEINWIEALTDVKILSEGREANSGKATYDVKTDEFMLEDKPSLKDGKNTLYGDRVRFWRASGRMVCEPQARLIIHPDKAIKTDFFER
jgi:lipopolysaccharide export system protein LptA